MQAWPKTALTPRLLLLGAVAIQLLLILTGREWDEWGESYLQACLLASLIASLALLGQVASATETMRDAARQLFAQPPGRRYLALGLGTHIFSLFLNIGGVAMITPLVVARRELLQASGELRASLLAIVRGFAASPMWGPLSLGVVVVISLVPGVGFLDLLPGGLALATLYSLAGYLIERWRGKRRTAEQLAAAARLGAPETQHGDAAPGPQTPLPGWAPLARIVLLVSTIAVTAIGIETATDLSFGQAILIVAVAMALGWAALGAQWRGQPVVRTTGQAVVGAFGKLQGEIVIISVSGFLSVALPLLISEPLAAMLGGATTPLAAATALALVPWCLIVPGLFGINPILSGSLVAGLLPGMLPGWLYLPLALAILSGWGTTAGGTPFSANMLIASRLAQIPAATLSLRWNGPLTLAFGLGSSLVLFAYVLLFWR